MKLHPRLLVVFAPSAVLGVTAAFVTSPLWRGLLIGLALGPIPAVIAVAGAIWFLRKRALAAHGLQPPPLPTAAWDYQLALNDLDGKPVPIADWAGDVLVLNFWATWCVPCSAEMPALRGLIERTADLRVRFAFISSESADVVRSFVAKKGWDLPFFVLTGEPPACFKSAAVPATFILDSTGSIVIRHIGAAAWNAESVVNFVRGLATIPQ